ncbi:MAG: PH domain-containing protein [Clostridiales bacterium]|jgi:hypothetical protein|nr:PH domain-containing protein [Clostridiales bacterium]
MIDFKNGWFKLAPISKAEGEMTVGPMLLDDEEVIEAFKSVRDKLIFTNKRIIAVNVQGVTGKKVDYTSLPYSRIQAFSVETAGVFDRDCELEVYISSIGRIKFELRGSFDIRAFNKAISKYIL